MNNSMSPTSKFLLAGISLLILLCCAGHKKKEAEPKPFHYQISIQVLDSTNLDTCFWKINRVLEKKHPKLFKNPPDMADTANPNYVTHLLKRYKVTWMNKTTSVIGAPYCVSPKDTTLLRKFLANPDYRAFFPPNTSFAYSAPIKNKSCLDLYSLEDQSIRFTQNDVDSIFTTTNYLGKPAIGVKPTSEAQKRLKAFSEQVMKREVVFLVNGSVYGRAIINGVLDRYFEIYPDLTADEINSLLASLRQ